MKKVIILICIIIFIFSCFENFGPGGSSPPKPKFYNTTVIKDKSIKLFWHNINCENFSKLINMTKNYGDDIDWDNWEYDPNDDGTWSTSVKNDEEEQLIFKDANWNILSEWDTVAAIKDIKVKWAKDIKRWDKFPKIRFTDEEGLIESWKMVLKTEFFKKI